MTVFEIVSLNITRIVFIGWLILALYYQILFFKSDKYLKVKEMDKDVRLSKADLKHEYKMAVLQSKNKHIDITKHDDLVSCMNLNFGKNIDHVLTAIDELVSWASTGSNNVEVLGSAKVIENYLGVRK